MKNLFRFLASSLANTLHPTTNERQQNNHSDGVCSTFFTSDGDQIQTFESSDAGITFGTIKIHLKEPYLYVNDAAEVLYHFMGLLQSSFGIEHTTEAVSTFSNHDKQHVTSAYWQDARGKDWKVLGWTNGQMLVVRYIKNINDLPVEWEAYFFRDGKVA